MSLGVFAQDGVKPWTELVIVPVRAAPMDRRTGTVCRHVAEGIRPAASCVPAELIVGATGRK